MPVRWMIQSASLGQSEGKVITSAAEKILFDRVALLDRVSGDEEIVKLNIPTGIFLRTATLRAISSARVDFPSEGLEAKAKVDQMAGTRIPDGRGLRGSGRIIPEDGGRPR